MVSSTARNMASKSSGKFRPTRRLIVAESVWQYSHHVLHGLISHRGPILTVANWSGTWPGLVGLLNLNGSLTKAGVKYSTLWSENFDDAFFHDGIRRWLKTGKIKHDSSHVRRLSDVKVPGSKRQSGQTLRRSAQDGKGHHGRFRRRMHGHVQRDHSRRTAASHRRLQGAP